MATNPEAQDFGSADFEAVTPSTLSREDGASIAYRRLAPDPARVGTLPGLVFLGGFASDMNGAKALALESHARASGQAFVRFDYQGHGASTGRREDGTIALWRDDSLAVLDGLTEGPQILIGSSMGGWLMLLAAIARPERVAGLIGIAAAPDFMQALVWDRLSEAARAQLMRDGFTRIATPYDPHGYVVTRAQIEDGRRHSLLDRPIPISAPVRLLHGTADAEVPWRHTVRLLDVLESSEVEMTLVKGGDHRLSSPTDLARLQAAVAALSASSAASPSR